MTTARTGRTPCINPRCRRTFDAAKYGSGEMICGKCFRSLPLAIRDEHRRLWRELRKWRRRIARTADQFKRHRMEGIERRFSAKINQHWDEVLRPAITTPQRPIGLDGFLAEVGL